MENLKKAQEIRWKIAAGVLVVINLLLGLWAYPRLPEQVPSHWNFAGEVDGYASAFQGAFLFPFILLGIYLLFWIIPRIDPKRANYTEMGRVFWIIAFAITGFLSLMYWGMIAVAL